MTQLPLKFKRSKISKRGGSGHQSSRSRGTDGLIRLILTQARINWVARIINIGRHIKPSSPRMVIGVVAPLSLEFTPPTGLVPLHWERASGNGCEKGNEAERAGAKREKRKGKDEKGKTKIAFSPLLMSLLSPTSSNRAARQR